MSYPTQSAALQIDSQPDDLRDVQGILVLLSLALAVIASPATPIIVARVTAVMAQHTAMAWADLLEDMVELNGGDL